MKKTRVAINGFGRIGRAFLRIAIERPEIEIVAINDLGDLENLVYLLRYDSVYGPFNKEVRMGKGEFAIDGRSIKLLQEKEPAKLPWRDLEIDVVVESTGFFTSFDKAKAHLDTGAKRAVITAPAHGDPTDETVHGDTVLVGINEDRLAHCQITSNASCTTNAASSVIQIMNEAIGIEKAILSTTHAYTASQRIVDSPNPKDWREGRAAAVNIIPSSTGAAHAVAQAIPEFEGKFDGIAMRVPIVTGSIADITFIAKRNTSVEEVNDIFKKAARDSRWEEILDVAEDPIVSSDIIGNLHAAVIDLAMTRVVDGNLVKILSWYDNEMGYANTLVKHVIEVGKYV